VMNGRVKSADKPGVAGSAGTYPGRVPEKFSGSRGTRDR